MASRRTTKLPARKSKTKEIQPLRVYGMAEGEPYHFEFDSNNEPVQLPLPEPVQLSSPPPDFDPSKLRKNEHVEIRRVKLKPPGLVRQPHAKSPFREIKLEPEDDLVRQPHEKSPPPDEQAEPNFQKRKAAELHANDNTQYDGRVSTDEGYVPFKSFIGPLSPDTAGRSLVPPPVLPDNRQPEKQTYELGMVQDDRIITKEGIRYFPVSLAAELAHVPRTTLVDWITAKITFNGRQLQTYNSQTAHRLYLTEESVQRVATRFIKLPSKEPAGPVALGERRDQSGYIGLPKAARDIGVDYHTLWLWTTQGKATPADKTLDVIQCTASKQFYIRQKDVAELKRLIPRSGLRRGRRPQLAMS